MKKLVFILAFVAANAYATNGGNNGHDASAVSGSQSAAVAVSGSASVSKSVAVGGSSNAEGGSATAAGGDAQAAGGAGGSVSYSNEDRRQAPAVIAPDVMPTSPCVVGGSGGLSVPGGGLSFGKGRIDPECELRETARLFGALGATDFALNLLCTSDAVKNSGLTCPEWAPQASSVDAGDENFAQEYLETTVELHDCNERLTRCEAVSK